jgi:hypothetical protein
MENLLGFEPANSKYQLCVLLLSHYTHDNLVKYDILIL